MKQIIIIQANRGRFRGVPIPVTYWELREFEVRVIPTPATLPDSTGGPLHSGSTLIGPLIPAGVSRW